MSVPQHQSGRRGTLAIALAMLAGFAIGYISSGIIGFVSGLAPEYNSAAAIRKVTEFVERNKTWPTSWADIDTLPLKGVNVNWYLDIGTCDRYDIMTSVAPATGSFYTYPHAERQLRDLWQVVLKLQNERSNQAVNGSRR